VQLQRVNDKFTRYLAVNAVMSSKRGKVEHLSGATQAFAMTNVDSCCGVTNVTVPYALVLASVNTWSCILFFS